MIIDGVDISHAGFLPEHNITHDELKSYVEYVKQRQPDVIRIKVSLRDDDTVDIDWTAHHTKFERIRRVTDGKIAARQQAVLS